jgi:coenzyme F420-reducing hydrogenase delta subunit
MGLMGKIKKFFDKSQKKQMAKADKLEAMIARLVLKAERLSKRSESAGSEEKRTRLLKEYNAVKKLLRKSRAHLKDLRCEAERDG